MRFCKWLLKALILIKRAVLNASLKPALCRVTRPLGDNLNPVGACIRGAMWQKKLLQKEFWEGLRDLGSSSNSTLNFGRAPRAQHWYNVSFGTSRCHLALTINSQKKYIACEVYIRDDPELYSEFLKNKPSIEGSVGAELDWMELPNATASRIR